MDINEFIKKIKDTVTSKAKEAIQLQQTAQQASPMAPVVPNFTRSLITDIKPQVEKYTSPATADFLNQILGFIGAGAYSPEEQQYFKDVKSGSLTPQDKPIGEALGQQDTLKMALSMQNPIKVGRTTPMLPEDISLALDKITAHDQMIKDNLITDWQSGNIDKSEKVIRGIADTYLGTKVSNQPIDQVKNEVVKLALQDYLDSLPENKISVVPQVKPSSGGEIGGVPKTAEQLLRKLKDAKLTAK